MRKIPQQLMPGWCWRSGLGDVAVTLTIALLIASALGIPYLNSSNWPTGGDTASHLLYAKLYADDFLFSGHVLPWMPEVFAGFPYLSYYFPLPFIVIALLSKVIGFAQAFKWGAFLAVMLLPGAVYAGSRRLLRFSWPAALFGALGALAYLVHEQNSIWGGNLLSTLSGEFAYSYSMLFAVLAMMAWARAIHLRRGWLLASLLEAACGFSHGFPLLVVGFSTAFLLLDQALTGTPQENWQRFKRSVGMLLSGHVLAFALLGGWLWPMLEMHSLTIPNDASFPVNGWRDLLPAALWPAAAGGVIGLALLFCPSVRRVWDSGQRLALCYFISAAGLSAVAFVAGDQLGLADIRFFPPVWLLGAVACGWLLGQALYGLARSGPTEAWFRRLPRGLLAAAFCFGLVGWLGVQIKMAPDWGLWNHSGLQAKPQWNNLSQLFPAMRGNLWSPRLVFEHDPANNDLGSTRTLEALPMFLDHRPVLEGLYMESALIGPAIYQLQSEVSAQPSSPLVRFPSGSLDPELAAKHMAFLHADTVLLRSAKAREALEASGKFDKVAESLPFAVYRMKNFDSHLAEVVKLPLQVRPKQDWMQDAFAWYRLRSRFDAYLPVYTDTGVEMLKAADQKAGPVPLVQEKSLDRHRMVFETSALGRPHLIKMAYHPRWHLESRGSLFVAGPGFMLVVPQEKEIRLVYGHTRLGTLGMVSTLIAALAVLFLLIKGGKVSPLAGPSGEISSGYRRYCLPLLAGWIFLVLAGLYFGVGSPERIYKKAWEAMNDGHLGVAAETFQRAYDLRRPPAKREEALFWTAKAFERAGKQAEAKAAYRELIGKFHGFWLPESLYTYTQLERQEGHGKAVEPLIRRLRDEYPNNPWTLKLDQPQ